MPVPGGLNDYGMLPSGESAPFTHHDHMLSTNSSQMSRTGLAEACRTPAAETPLKTASTRTTGCLSSPFARCAAPLSTPRRFPHVLPHDLTGLIMGMSGLGAWPCIAHSLWTTTRRSHTRLMRHPLRGQAFPHSLVCAPVSGRSPTRHQTRTCGGVPSRRRFRTRWPLAATPLRKPPAPNNSRHTHPIVQEEEDIGTLPDSLVRPCFIDLASKRRATSHE